MLIDWELSNTTLATISDDVSFHTIENIFDGYKTLNRSRILFITTFYVFLYLYYCYTNILGYQLLIVKGLEGLITIKAKVVGYSQEKLRAQGIFTIVSSSNLVSPSSSLCNLSCLIFSHMLNQK